VNSADLEVKVDLTFYGVKAGSVNEITFETVFTLTVVKTRHTSGLVNTEILVAAIAMRN